MKLFRKKGANLPSDQTNTQVTPSLSSNNIATNNSSIAPKTSLFSKRNLIIFCVVTGFLVVAGTLAFVTYNNTQKKNETKASSVCTSKAAGDVLQQASKNLSKENTKDLQPIAEKIKTLKDYDKDPNCLYVVAKYDLNRGDSKSASEDIEKLKEVYSDKVGFDQKLKGSNASNDGTQKQSVDNPTNSLPTNSSSPTPTTVITIEQLTREQSILKALQEEAKTNGKGLYQKK